MSQDEQMRSANLKDEEEDLAKQLDEIRMNLPTRAEHECENDVGFGVDASAFLNIFTLDKSKAPDDIFQYELTFTLVKPDNVEHQLHNATTKVHEYARSVKRNALLRLLRLIHIEDDAFFRKQELSDEHNWRKCCAFDCASFYYTGVRLDDREGKIEEATWKKSEPIKWYLKGRGHIRWNLRFVGSFPIKGEAAKKPEALQFFNILAQQMLMRDKEMDVRPDAAYMPGGDTTKDNKELRKGIVTSVKVLGDEVCLQLDSKIAMFFQEMPLIQYVKMFAAGADLKRYLFDPSASRKLRNELKNLPMRCRHLESRKTFECKGLSDKDANQIKFELKEGEGLISIAEYFERKYHYKLKYPHLPLIIERKGQKESFHPIECLDIADGIRVSNQKMSRDAQENMISKSCRAPIALGRDLEECRDKAGLDGVHNEYLHAFGILPKKGFQLVHGKILYKPQITGLAGIHPDINDRGQIAYTKGGFKFAVPVNPSKPITLISLDNALRESECGRIRQLMGGVAHDFGMTITFADIREPMPFGGHMDSLREFMASQKSRTSMFFFITKEKLDESHNMVKKLEQELGVVTQLICFRTASDILNNKRVTSYNVISKMNQKLGGVVANPEVPPLLKAINPDAYKRACADWFKDRMFVGFTLSHAGAQSYADRLVSEEVREPTCVGMAWTLKHAGKRTAISWFQEKRKAYIDDITRHFVRALDTYAESNGGKHPVAILIFRKGMAEGELEKAAYEVKQIMQAIKLIGKRPGMENYTPTIQCMVCMANTTDRLLYNGGDLVNAPAGACMIDGATNPRRAEFLIVPHNAIKGTAKAVRCTMVHNVAGLRMGRKLNFSELQMIYNTMCYLNGVAASPTRLPVPLADSEKAAERQMNIFKEQMRNGDDTMSLASGRSGGGVKHDGSADFYQRLSDEFAHKFKDCQYYA